MAGSLFNSLFQNQNPMGQQSAPQTPQNNDFLAFAQDVKNRGINPETLGRQLLGSDPKFQAQFQQFAAIADSLVGKRKR